MVRNTQKRSQPRSVAVVRALARLIAKVFHADPLTCRKCGGKLKIVAYLGPSPPEEPKPPPAVHEVVRVPVDEEGREMEAP